jgi:hypothetical protein
MDSFLDPTLLSIITGLTCGLWAAVMYSVWWVISQVRESYKNRIVSRRIRRHVEQATNYRNQIRSMLNGRRRIASRVRLEQLAGQIDSWTADVEALARRIDRFQNDKLIRRDLSRLPGAIRSLERQLAGESRQEVRARLGQTLENRKQHLTSLQRLQATMQRAEIEIEHTISSMGIIYSQVFTGQSTSHVESYSHLSVEVDEQIQSLQDYLEAMDEVHQERAERLGA